MHVVLEIHLIIQTRIPIIQKPSILIECSHLANHLDMDDAYGGGGGYVRVVWCSLLFLLVFGKEEQPYGHLYSTRLEMLMRSSVFLSKCFTPQKWLP